VNLARSRRIPRALIVCAAIVCALGLPRTSGAQTAGDLPLSAQLYTARDAGTLDQQFAVIAKAGFRNVEMFRFYGMAEVPAKEVKALLDKHGLKVSGYHVAFSELIDNLKNTIEYNKALGNTRLIIPAFSATVTPTTREGWEALGHVVRMISVEAKAAGMQVGFHNHTQEMQLIDGKTEIEWFADAAGPDVIITIDCAWAAQGDQDPAQLIRRLKGRVWNIHVKDNAPRGMAQDQRGLATVGKGTLNWDEILKAAHESGVQWFTVEMDVPKPDALTVLQESRAFIEPKLRKVLGR
jgi:sugar phosphate isomerase/epimerase